MSRSHTSKLFKLNKKRLYIVSAVLLLLIIVPSALFGWYSIYFSNRIYPNVYFNNISLGGKAVSEAADAIRQEADKRLQASISYTLQDGSSVELGQVRDFASYDIDQTVKHAFEIGRKGTIQEQLLRQINLLRYKTHIPPVFAYNAEEFEQKFISKFQPYEKPVINSSLSLSGDSLVLTPSQPGVVADRNVATGEFERYLAMQRETSSFAIAIAPKDPDVTPENGKAALERARAVLGRTVTLSSSQLPGSTWTITKAQLVPMIELKNIQGNVEPVFVDYKVASWSAQIASLVNRDPVDAKFQYEGDRVGVFEPAQPGLELDTMSLTQKISEVAFDASRSSEIDIPLKVTQPALSTENVNNYGIKELVATGKSKFRGSPAGRVHNVQLASNKLNGVLVAPGEEFSMYKHVGEVEKATGYMDAFVILNGRTVPGVGGGLCQVSTTLFRAVLNAGLPITERRQHAYRVSYYEQDAPAGMDAAVYFPTWDFKFVNDTGNHLLLQTKVDTKAMTAEFNLYGVKDGRTVEVTKPIISNQSPPPPELRLDDPTLPRGQEKEVDHAVWGANAVFSRTVIKDGQEHLKDSFKSSYRPWQRVVMVGVKDN